MFYGIQLLVVFSLAFGNIWEGGGFLISTGKNLIFRLFSKNRWFSGYFPKINGFPVIFEKSMVFRLFLKNRWFSGYFPKINGFPVIFKNPSIPNKNGDQKFSKFKSTTRTHSKKKNKIKLQQKNK